MTKPTNKTSSSSAAMRIQKPARGIAAVMCGDTGLGLGGTAPGGTGPGGAEKGGAAAGGTGSAAVLDSGAAAAAAPTPGAGPAVHPAPAIVAELERSAARAPANAEDAEAA